MDFRIGGAGVNYYFKSMKITALLFIIFYLLVSEKCSKNKNITINDYSSFDQDLFEKLRPLSDSIFIDTASGGMNEKTLFIKKNYFAFVDEQLDNFCIVDTTINFCNIRIGDQIALIKKKHNLIFDKKDTYVLKSKNNIGFYTFKISYDKIDTIFGFHY